MNWQKIKAEIPTSPAFILNEDNIIANLQPLQQLRHETGCKILYSMKALPLGALLELLKNEIDGISASSLFEAKLAAEVLQGKGSVHLTTPGLRSDEFAELSSLCSHISFNSLTQFRQLALQGRKNYSIGLRINPKLSFADDARFDPCRRHSKLGVAIGSVCDGLPSSVEGLHVHTVFAREDFLPLTATLNAIWPLLEQAKNLKWLNLGGGYLFSKIHGFEPLISTLNELRQRFALDIYLEPGKAIVGNAGYLLTTVLDRFESDGKTLIVLDTSVNHNPEVFEYQRQPLLLEHEPNSSSSALLVGSTCLAGDLFGEYCFGALPDVGDRLVFADVGAYSLIKANRFNGYNLPAIYTTRNGQFRMVKNYDYEAYYRQWI